MVTVPIHQASSSAPPLSIPIIDLTHPKPISPLVQEPIFTATTATTATTTTTTLMFESGSYKSQPEHAALYDALEPQAQRPQLEDSDTREAPSSSSKQKTAPQSKQPVDDVPIPDDVHISDSEDTGDAHLLKIKTCQTWNNWANAIAKAYKDPEENKLIQKTRDMGSKWYCKNIGKLKLSKADLEGPAFKINLVNPEGIQVVPDVSKPLPLGGPPGDKERMNALSISKLKASYYPNFGLKELVPSLWIEFRSHMNILSFVSLKTFSRYCYTFLREIVLHRANYKEFKISKADFKNLHLNDFEELLGTSSSNNAQEDLQLEIENYQMKLNLTQPSWDATNFLFKEDDTIIHKSRAIIYRDMINQKKMMRESEVHKFSDGTSTRILEKLDHMVKDYVLFQFNPSMKHRILSEDDKRRSKEFIKVIERRLKIRRIFRNLESFVSGRVRDIDYIIIQRT
ncbi:hypothetical protein Tco_0450984 [Tanacetum coccineum]